MTVSQTYLGVPIDICALETSALPGIAAVNVGFSDAGSVISGPYKVIQKFVKNLMTERGSVAADPTYGSDFITKLLGGHIQTKQGLETAFYTDLPDLINYLRTTVLNPTANENIKTVILSDFIVSLDKASMKLVFTFQDSSVILAPITISTV